MSLEVSEKLCRDNIRYLNLLSKQYPTISQAANEIINLESILNLPKGTEHFLSDIHGESEPFVHVLRNGSGVVKRKIEELFGDSIMESEKKTLATLVYYPEQKLEIVLKEEENIDDWYKVTLHRIVELCRYASTKYTKDKVRKYLPKDFAYIIEELLNTDCNIDHKKKYYQQIINTIIDTDRSKEFITAISKLIQRLVIDRLHIIGDIYDRGPRPDIIIDTLMDYHSVDIQWGNHDILWMGAAAGQKVCIANALRISARYANLDIVEDIYGINILPLATFALNIYKDDPCEAFLPKISEGEYNKSEISLIAKMHKAISIIQFKLEHEIIKRRPEFNMNHRCLLEKINYERGIITLKGKEYKLKDTNFPTIDPKNPYKLTKEEEVVIDKLKSSFINSEKLQKHTSFLFSKGSIYLNFNSNLLFHGCIPLNEDGSFKKFTIEGIEYKGKELMDKFDSLAREGYFYREGNSQKEYGMDIMWYLWTGEASPLFGKDDMATFERYFIKEKETHKENKNAYFKLRDTENMCNMIFEEFGLDKKESHIINGHVPVECKKGESPMKANGKLIAIDGGFSRAYQQKTGIAGYTLIYNSYSLQLVSHQHFTTTEQVIYEESDILSTTSIVERNLNRKYIRDTDIGKDICESIKDLKLLLLAYRKGLIKES
ncbi:fructose-1 [[Clostridium] sordellii]|uniref:Fructose-1,6-bisphosphatase class 3 n=1 Tax=Paraclostridium sordellii TaxID=1505 RepID=A0A9P1L3M0_PARSO|nr:fructose-bisphosphatase class III [Paeniclostridium sordellii]AUN13998.1 fructose-bisphosphatase class III [Paeniclostridium sordellii]MCH1965883.1 fructose-bisphosphatase class III [Paeniclostridium sordellii]MCQ4696457.1 fructose-bisphosphatase class III [Paeniclostridium sordellii]MCR1848654.1 fructose-bisphosphatase class III [Paeniclostridium sordellii]MDU1453218.1 fructose-bisphosphatase class III [Paeniclostridium sordellii]